MGKIYIKEENGKKVMYEENNSPIPFFGDEKLGELHKNWDGSLETRNAFGENYKLSEKRDSWDDLGEAVTFFVPRVNKYDYNAETSDGESGTFEWNLGKRRHEFKKELADHSNYSSNERITYNRGSSSYGSSKSKGGRGLEERVTRADTTKAQPTVIQYRERKGSIWPWIGGGVALGIISYIIYNNIKRKRYG